MSRSSNLALVAPRCTLRRETTSPPDWREYLVERLTRPNILMAELVDLAVDAADADPDCKPGTLRDLKSAGKCHIKPAFGSMRARALEQSHVIAWIEALKSCRKRKTVHKVRSHLSRVCHHGVLLGAMDNNPALNLPRGVLPKNKTGDARLGALEVLDLDAIAQLIYDKRIPAIRRALWGLLLLTGMRFSEAAAVTFADYDVAARRITISKSWDCRARQIVTAKAGEIQHTPVPKYLAPVLEDASAWYRWHQLRPAEADDLIAPYGEHERLRHWHETTAIRRWRTDLDLLGIAHPTGRLHAARHTFCSQLVRAGADPRVVRSFTHVSPEDTSCFAIYAHLDWSAALRAVDKFKLDGRLVARLRRRKAPR